MKKPNVKKGDKIEYRAKNSGLLDACEAVRNFTIVEVIVPEWTAKSNGSLCARYAVIDHDDNNEPKERTLSSERITVIS